MKYEVQCECGKPHLVSATDAGAPVRCACGRTFDVPPAHRLRAAAGQDGVAPELTLRAMLANGELPDADACARCGEPTDGSVVALVECEREEERPEERRPSGCLPLPFGVFVFYRTAREAEVRGRDVIFQIPVRACPGCARLLVGGELRGALRRNRVCAGVLDKYPHARITRA